MRDRVKNIIRYTGISIWILFTVSLTGWWLIFALRQLDTMHSLDLSTGSKLASHHRMLIWEGAALLVCVIGGGAALLYDAYRELRLTRRLRLFFLTFAHEIKTPLSSLRLQAESLAEDLRNTASIRLVERLLADTSRLSMRIENSLFLTTLDKPVFCYEDIDLRSLLASLHAQWPAIRIDLDCDAELRADRRALEAIFNNLIQNSIVHGRASTLAVRVRQHRHSIIHIEVHDSGEGFRGDRGSLGELFSRPSRLSGSGLGLYLCRELVERMGGKFIIQKPQAGFGVELQLRGRIL